MSTVKTSDKTKLKKELDESIDNVDRIIKHNHKCRENLKKVIKEILKIQYDTDGQCLKSIIKVGHKVGDTFYTHLNTYSKRPYVILDDDRSVDANISGGGTKIIIEDNNNRKTAVFWLKDMEDININIDCEFGYTRYNISFIYSGFENNFCPLFYYLIFIEEDSYKQKDAALSSLYNSVDFHHDYIDYEIEDDESEDEDEE